MTSGRSLSTEEDIAIRRMAALKTADGRWKWTYDLIATAIGVERQAISEAVRRRCAEFKPHPTFCVFMGPRVKPQVGL